MIATRSGFVSGVEERTGPEREADPVLTFKGIPYAAASSGNGRFRPPAPVTPWGGVRKCEEFGPACPQPRAILWPLPGPKSEDCLHLNVWTPAADPRRKCPVLVWFHGGGFSTGAGGSLLYDGAALARMQAVVVTFNYRLGPFGFLAHPELTAESPAGASGNYGLMDQLAVLEWVRDNIENFGGDPGNVTIFGESAGASSVCRLAVIARARGLFHRVIAHSGAVQGPNRRGDRAVGGLESMEDVGRRLARDLGCRTGNAPECLRSASAEAILGTANPAQGLFSQGTRFGPIVDGVLLPDDPETMFQKGESVPVPWIIGTNADEGTIFVSETGVTNVAAYRDFLARHFGDFHAEVGALYPASSDEDIPAALNRLITDRWFLAPARSLARTLASQGRSVWMYRFSRVSPAARKKGLGAFHASEVSYLFGRVGNRLAYEDRDMELSEAMRRFWMAFARQDSPDPGPGERRWQPVEPGASHALDFGDTIETVDLDFDGLDLMDRIHASEG